MPEQRDRPMEESRLLSCIQQRSIPSLTAVVAGDVVDEGRVSGGDDLRPVLREHGACVTRSVAVAECEEVE